MGGKRDRVIFTYGTLKRGFWNHKVMEELIESGDARYVGGCRTKERYPLVCGPYRVPFLLNLAGQGERVWGEVYEVSDAAITRMDELEGISRGHYERLPISLCLTLNANANAHDSMSTPMPMPAEAYFAHRSYADSMWRRNGHIGFSAYSQKEATGYIKRKDRPQHLSFLDQISIFLSST